VLVLDGWHSPGITAWGLSRRLRRRTGASPADVHWATYPWALSVRAAARHALRVIRRRGLQGVAIDVVGISMGGIVARVLAAGLVGPPVRIVRLFTISTPHRGARLARYVRPDFAARDLAPGSRLLAALDDPAATRPESIHCLALARDWFVGEENTAPPDVTPRIYPPRGLVARALAHFASIYDEDLQDDLARRLRAP
jgi:pimeloyl-ACP methyl ester carboxylesterase